jgi:Skp family chaperone for outer membrane proteins
MKAILAALLIILAMPAAADARPKSKPANSSQALNTSGKATTVSARTKQKRGSTVSRVLRSLGEMRQEGAAKRSGLR